MIWHPSHTKGICLNDIKEAAQGLTKVVDDLLRRSEPEEVIRLRRNAKQLRRQVEDLREQGKAWQREANDRKSAIPPPSLMPEMEEPFSQTMASGTC